MNKLITIASLNVGNNYFLTNPKVQRVTDFIKNQENVIFCAQEVTSCYKNQLKKQLGRGYAMSEHVSNIHQIPLHRLPIANESPAIITSSSIHQIENSYELLSVNNGMRSMDDRQRFIVNSKCLLNNEKYSETAPFVYTFQLDFREEHNKVQMAKLMDDIWLTKQILPQSPFIIAGQTNSNLKNENGQQFIEKLEKLGIKRVPINGDTYKGKTGGVMSHIFLSEEFEVNDCWIEEGDYSSKHELIAAKVYCKK